MTNNLNAYECGDDDVIAFGESMFRSGKLKRSIAQSFDGSVGRAIDQKLRQHGLDIPTRMIGSTRLANEHCQWFDEGISCEILDLGTRRWRKGKVRVRVSVEFLVEEPNEKKLLPGDVPEEGLHDRPNNADRSNSMSADSLSHQDDLSSDEYVNSEYVLAGIHTNNQ